MFTVAQHLFRKIPGRVLEKGNLLHTISRPSIVIPSYPRIASSFSSTNKNFNGENNISSTRNFERMKYFSNWAWKEGKDKFLILAMIGGGIALGAVLETYTEKEIKAKRLNKMHVIMEFAEQYYTASALEKMEKKLQEADELAEELVENKQPIPKEYYLKKAILLAKTTIGKNVPYTGRDEQAVAAFNLVPEENSDLYLDATLALARMYIGQISHFPSRKKKLEEEAKKYYCKFLEKRKDKEVEVEAEYQKLIKQERASENTTSEDKIINVNYDPADKEKVCKRPSLQQLQRMGIITPYEYATMNGYLYTDIVKYKLLPEWEVFYQIGDLPPAALKQCVETGYVGLAFHNKINGKIVIAHRGTYDGKGIAADTELVFGEIPAQFACAEQFAQYVVFTAQQRNLNINLQSITQTGHSLGAAIAELCAIRFGSRAITFESPGIKNLALSDRKKFKLEHGAKNITTYLSYPNLVNTYDKHLGRIIHIPTSRETRSFINHVLEYQGFLGGASRITLENIKAHGIEGLWGAFDKESGYPKDFFCMQSWPSSTKRFVYLVKFVSEKRNSINPDAYFFNPSVSDFALNQRIKYKIQSDGNGKSPRMNLSDFDDETKDFLLNYAKSEDYRKYVNRAWRRSSQKELLGEIECFLSYTLEKKDTLSVRSSFMADEFEDYVIFIRSPFMPEEFIECVGKVVALQKELKQQQEVDRDEAREQHMTLGR